MTMSNDKRVFVAGARGMVGSAIVRRLRALGYIDILTPGRDTLDMLDQGEVDRYFSENSIEEVYFAASGEYMPTMHIPQSSYTRI